MTKYSKNFIAHIKEQCKNEKQYIGTGNPNAKILIIGCECAIGKDPERYAEEIVKNAQKWQMNIDFKVKGIHLDIIENCLYLNPLYPYKGQKHKINNGKNCGTSRTWLNYQKLHNQIFECYNSDKINFHEKVFITEFSTITALNKKAITEDETLNIKRKESIGLRAKMFEKSLFFQDFPIVIVATGGAPYVDNKVVKLWEIFDVDFKEKKICKKGKIYYNIHRNKEGGTSKLIIHTWQFGGNISDIFLIELAKLCRDFIKNNKIEI